MQTQRQKVAIFFTNIHGKYIVHNVSLFVGDEVPETIYHHEPVFVVDETKDWSNYKLTKNELSMPSTRHNECFTVVQYVNC